MVGLSCDRIGCSNLLVPIACKVSINMQVKVAVWIRFHDETFVHCAFEALANAFDSFTMLPLGVMGESGTSMDSMKQVRSS